MNYPFWKYEAKPDGSIVRDDGVIIPHDPENADYQAYLKQKGQVPANTTAVVNSLPPSLADNLVSAAASLRAAVTRAQGMVDRLNASTAAIHARMDELDALQASLDALNKQLGP